MTESRADGAGVFLQKNGVHLMGYAIFDCIGFRVVIMKMINVW